MNIFVVIPAYNESAFIKSVIEQIPESVHTIIVVDDCSTDDTPNVVSSIKDDRIKLIRLEKNEGVGGAVKAGYKQAIQSGADIVVKIDGDGQMDPREIQKIVLPIQDGRADYCKGFRFHTATNIKQMPKIRLFGNVMLSFLTKVASGYWNIFDPTSGYTAIHQEALSRLPLDEIDSSYFFETDMLINLYKLQAVIKDVEIANTYGEEESQLSPFRVMLTFPSRLIKSTLKRIIWRYFLIDYTAVSLFITVGLPMFVYGCAFGLFNWIKNASRDIPTPVGTIMITTILLFFGFELLLQAFVLDIQNTPNSPLQKQKKIKYSA